MKDVKEEAGEILEKFRPHADMWDCYYDVPYQDKNDIKCAIIHVEGIIKVLWKDDYENRNHWNQVLTELKSM